MAETELYIGNLDQSEKYFLQLEQIQSTFEDSTALYPYHAKLVYLYKLKGETQKANQLAEETIELLKERIKNAEPNFWTGGQGDTLYNLGEMYAVLGDSDKALDLLEKPYAWDWAGLSYGYWWLEHHQLFDPIRNSKRFKDLEEKKRLEYEAYAEVMRQLVREKEMNWEFALEQNR